jgi:hypothetical protein
MVGGSIQAFVALVVIEGIVVISQTLSIVIGGPSFTLCGFMGFRKAAVL